MNKIIIILIAAVIPQIAFSQEYKYVPFSDSGAIWSEVYYYPEPTWPDTIIKPPSYERFTLNGEDTIINDITYKKLYIISDSVFNKSKATYIGGIREDENKRVYFKSDTVLHAFKPILHSKEIILYDFSLKVGDTIKNINCMPEYDILIISKIDSVLINNNYRKKFHFNPMPWIKWIEGIGNLNGLLFTSGDIPSNGVNGALICFKQNNEILYFNNDFNECFPLITSIETKTGNSRGIKLFPNPSSGHNKITFDFGKKNNDIDNIQIIDCNGRIIEDCEVSMQSTYILSTEKYKPGIYFYKATNNKGIEHTGMFVVQ